MQPEVGELTDGCISIPSMPKRWSVPMALGRKVLPTRHSKLWSASAVNASHRAGVRALPLAEKAMARVAR